MIDLFLATHAQIKDGVCLDGEQAKIPVATNYAIDLLYRDHSTCLNKSMNKTQRGDPVCLFDESNIG